MIEPEIAFCDLTQNMDCVEGYLRHCFSHVLAECGEDLAFLDALLENGAAVTTADVPFVRVRHARNVAQDAAGDGEEGVVAARAAAEACGLPARTVDFLSKLC